MDTQEEKVTEEKKDENVVIEKEEVKENPISYREQVNNLYREKNGQDAKEEVFTGVVHEGRDMNKIILIITGVVVVIFIVFYLYKNTGLFHPKQKKNEDNNLAELIDANQAYGTKIEKELEDYKLIPFDEETCTNTEDAAITWHYCLDSNGNALNVYSMNSISNEVEIPSTLDGHKVISVGKRNSNRQFGLCTTNVYCKGIVKVIVPDGVEYIESYFLMNSEGIEEVVLPDSVKYIGEYAFYNSPNIMKINSNEIGTFIMPASLEYYGTHLFGYNKYVQKFEFPESIDYINRYTFQYCSAIRKLVIDGHFKYIMPGAFADNKITSVEFKEGVYVVSGFANNTNLTEVIMSDSVKYLYELTFANDVELKKIEFDGKLYYLGNNVLSGTKLDINDFFTMKNLDLYTMNEQHQEELARQEREKLEKEEEEQRKKEEAIKRQQEEDEEKIRKEQEDAEKKDEPETCAVDDEECIARVYGE